MAGKLSLISAEQTEDGQVRGTFKYSRDGLPSLTFPQVIPGQATQQEVGKILLDRVGQIVLNEPVPALGVVNEMFAAGARAIPDAPPAE